MSGLWAFLTRQKADDLYQALSAIGAKGSIYAGTGAGATAERTVGSNGLAMVADSAESTGMKWAAVGRLLGIKSYRGGSDTQYSTTSTSFVDMDATNLTVTFTAPASGNVLVKLEANFNQQTSGNHYWALRDSGGDVSGTSVIMGGVLGSNVRTTAPIYITGLTPGTSYTYKFAWKVASGTGGIFYGPTYGPVVMEVWECP